MLCMAPMGPVPLELHTTKNPPGYHEQTSVEVILPAGIIAFGLTSPSEFQVPTKYASFLTSGPGLGGPAFFSSAAEDTAAAKSPQIASKSSLDRLMVSP